MKALWLVTIARVLVGGLFLFSAWQKLKPDDMLVNAGPQQFAYAVKGFELVPEGLIPFVTALVPWTEVVAGLALILGFWTRAASGLLAAMLVAFTLAVISVILRPEVSVECGCFGRLKLICSGPVSWCKVGENSIILAFTLAPVIFGGGRLAVDRALCPPKA